MLAGEIDDLNFLDQLFAAAAIFDEFLYGTNLELMSLGESLKFGKAGHIAGVIHDFADDADWATFGKFGEVHGRFSMASALEHAAGACAQRKDMPWLHEVIRYCGGIGHGLDRLGTVLGADARGDTFGGINAHLEIRLETFLIARHHAFDAELA